MSFPRYITCRDEPYDGSISSQSSEGGHPTPCSIASRLRKLSITSTNTPSTANEHAQTDFHLHETPSPYYSSFSSSSSGEYTSSSSIFLTAARGPPSTTYAPSTTSVASYSCSSRSSTAASAPPPSTPRPPQVIAPGPTSNLTAASLPTPTTDWVPPTQTALAHQTCAPQRSA